VSQAVVYRVVATAGHVDHGKSTLVKALTGTDPDRLREEQERQMTIDLGFAALPLPSGIIAGIVDVPGHRDFIHNMLAGVGGIDAVLLIIAADEGIMPQTKEHIAILDLLGIANGIIVLTKADMVEDDWLNLVVEEVREQVAGTSLSHFPICITSATTGQGLPELVRTLDTLLGQLPPPPDLGQARLPIDRVFSLRGHGTVVTGTLTGGRLSLGQAVIIQPSGLQARIRSLQTHGRALEVAMPGSRVAANLVGLQKEQVHRGEVLSDGDWLRPTRLFDACVRYLESASVPLEHGDELQLFSGTFDSLVRVRLLEADYMAPGSEQWVQIVCDQAMPICRGDRFILRTASPSATVGGGTVVDSSPVRRHKRFDSRTLSWLGALKDATEEQQVLMRLERNGPAPLEMVARWLDVSLPRARALVRLLIEQGQVSALGPGTASGNQIVAARANWEALSRAARDALHDYHQRYPLRQGMPREELRRILRLRQAVFASVVAQLATDGLLAEDGDRLRLAGWQPQLSADDASRLEAVMARLSAAGAAGLAQSEVVAEAGPELLQAAVAAGRIIRLPDDILISAEAFNSALASLVRLMQERGRATVAEIRDTWASNRRSTLALLSVFDDQGITRRDGDKRVPGRRFPETMS